MKIAVAGIALVGAASLVLAGCSSDSSVGGTVECNDTTIAEAVTRGPHFRRLRGHRLQVRRRLGLCSSRSR
jgi:hypothetical protein